MKNLVNIINESPELYTLISRTVEDEDGIIQLLEFLSEEDLSKFDLEPSKRVYINALALLMKKKIEDITPTFISLLSSLQNKLLANSDDSQVKYLKAETKRFYNFFLDNQNHLSKEELIPFQDTLDFVRESLHIKVLKQSFSELTHSQKIEEITLDMIRDCLLEDQQSFVENPIYHTMHKSSIRISILKQLSESEKMRMFFKTKGHISIYSSRHSVIAQLYENPSERGLYEPFNVSTKEELAVEIKKCLMSWTDNEYINLFVTEAIANTEGSGFELTEEEKEKLNILEKEMFLPYTSIKDFVVLFDGSFKKEYKEHYKNIENKTKASIDDIQFRMLRKYELENHYRLNFSGRFDLILLNSPSAYYAGNADEVFFSKLKADKKHYENVLSNTTLDIIDFFVDGDPHGKEYQKQIVADLFIYRLNNQTYPLEWIQFLTFMPKNFEKAANNVNGDDFTYNSKVIQARKLFEVYRLLKQRKKILSRQLKNILISNVSLIEKKGFKTDAQQLFNGVLNEKQALEVLYAMYPKTIMNMLLLDNFEVNCEEDFANYLSKVDNDKLKRLFVLI